MNETRALGTRPTEQFFIEISREWLSTQKSGQAVQKRALVTSRFAFIVHAVSRVVSHGPWPLVSAVVGARSERGHRHTELVITLCMLTEVEG